MFSDYSPESIEMLGGLRLGREREKLVANINACQPI